MTWIIFALVGVTILAIRGERATRGLGIARRIPATVCGICGENCEGDR